MANEKLRADLKKSKVAFWMLAEKMERCENTIQRQLRTELKPEDEKKYREVMAQIIAERQQGK